MNNIKETLRNNLLKFRSLNNLTQQEVADYLNVSRSTYTYYELGKTEPGLENLRKLTEIFEVDYNTILKSE